MADEPDDLELEGVPNGQEGEGEEEGRAVAAGEDEAEGDQGTGEQGPDEEGEEGQVDDQPAARPNRAEARIRKLTETLKEEKAERQRIDRELAEIRAAERQRAQQTQQESPEAKASRRALMDPLEVMREDQRDAETRTQGMLQQMRMEQQETGDKLTYNTILKDAPHLRKYEAEVEKIRKEQPPGVFVPREVILDLVIGRAARAAAAKGGQKARQQGQQRVAAQQAKPAGARGDAATQRGKQGDSPEKRLENVPI